MLHLEIETPGQPPSRFELPTGSYTIGRSDACKIRLRHPEISERHALLAVRPAGIWIEDLNASNGTFLDEVRVQGQTPVQPGQLLRIGPYLLQLLVVPGAETPPAAATPLPAPAPAQPPNAALPQETTGKTAFAGTGRIGSLPPPPRDPQLAIRREIKNQIHREVVQRLDIKRMTAARVDAEELHRRAREAIHTVIEEVRTRQRLPPGIDPVRLAEEICNEALRLGPLEEFLADESVTEVMVNGPHQIFVERNGRLELTGQDFMDESSVQAIIERIVAPIGRRIDESQPYVDARLPDGSRVNAIIPPLSLSGPCITIRKFSKRAFTDEDFIRFQTWTEDMTKFLRICVQLRKNIIVSGGTGSGKTSLLNVLGSYLPPNERILTIEDAAELRLNQPHVIRLEARPPNIEGRGAITIRDLVRNALRMRPDRIIVGECRGGEALDMLQAMNTGHDGSLTTVHANSPRDVISRIETMVLMSGLELPSRAIREQIASALDLIVHESRLSDGSRKVTNISEIVGIEGSQIVMQDIFEFAQTGLGEGGKVLGHFRATGAVPTFLEDLKARGLELDPKIFQPSRERTPAKENK
ncbi:MAG: ATPase, T2SS/T4P/T4SS family [Kiritimatiellia bacterium]